MKKFICTVCGYVYEGEEAPEFCPQCKVPRSKFKELVEIIAKALVDNPDEVVVTETENEKAIVLELRVAQSDMGKVIGKQGRIAKAIRSVVKAAASKEEKKVIVEIMQ